nr:reverse transcriptase domain-containing protein [Tanacetum cinerariifolium]
TSESIAYGYDGLLIQPVASPSPDYVPGPEHPPSPDYVPGPEHPPSPIKIPYVPELEYPEYLAPSDDEAPLEDQPLPADASPIAASPDYVADSDPEEDPEEDLVDDQADYPVDGGDGDDEPFEDDDDDYTDDEDPKRSPLRMMTRRRRSTQLRPTLLLNLLERKTVRPEPPMSASMEACIARHAAFPSPPPLIPSLQLPFPSPLTTSLTDIGAPLGYRAVGIRIRALLLSTSRRTDIPEADMPPQKRACLTAPTPRFNIGEISATGAARQPGPTESDHRRSPTTLEGVNERVTELDTTVRKRTYKFETQLTTTLRRIEVLEGRDPVPQEGPVEAGSSWTFVYLLAMIKMAPRRRTARVTPAATTTPTTTVTNAQLQALIDRGVTAALAERNADRSRNGNNSNDSGIGGRRQMTTPRECSYTNFLKCQPMSFQGTEGVVGSALTWWNSYIRAVRQDVAYAMPWAALKRMITSKYCPRGEIQKMESEFWNLKVKGLDLLNFNHRFQELALICERMFPKEVEKVERYIDGLPDMIHGSVKASKPQSMHEAIEFATKMMDKKMLTHAERQAE